VGWDNCNRVASDGCEQAVVDDPENCGACGRTCDAVAHGTAHCAGVDCAIDSCDAGWDNCDALGYNGCESNLATDLQDCGECGNACDYANAVNRCEAGSCVITECSANFRDCNQEIDDGCEANLRADPENCGSCGTACSANHASGTCTNGLCFMGECDAGYANCNRNPADGCEISLADDAENCGACGVACNLSHATAACDQASCVVAACEAGHGDCDGDAANGCEVDLATDEAHCGACGEPCALDHASAVCNASTCAIARCDADYADCDAEDATGCEIDLNTDAANCGRCGIACGEGEACVGGSCECADADGDDHAKLPCGDDCNDTDPDIYPGATEACEDLVDNDCDGNTDEGCEEEPDDGGGCGCSSSSGAGGAAVPVLFALLGLALLRRRG
jgi:MYXO-CTERM domain-containing protein